MPQNLEAEENLLATMMLSRAACDAALEVLEPAGETKFFRESHGVIYQAARGLHIDGADVDVITLTARLDETPVPPKMQGRNMLELIGGASRLHALAGLVPPTVQAARYARIVRDTWARRELLKELLVTQERVSDHESSEQALDAAEKALLDLRGKLQRGRSDVRTALELAQQFDEQLKNPPDESAGIPSPWSFFPPLLGGRVYVIAGYTGDGKTVQGVEFAKAAAKHGKKVGFFSIEMPADDLTDRIIASFGIPIKQVAQRRISTAHHSTYAAAIAEFARWNLEIVDDPNANAVTMLRHQRARRYDLIVVDHLHDIVLDGRPSDRRILLEEEIGRIRTLARVENVPVVLLAQLSRIPGPRPFPRPTLSSLRETGKIEQIAWMVGFVWRKRDEKNQPENDALGRGIAEFIVAKNRSGPIGTVDLRFIGDQTRYIELGDDEGRRAA